MLHAPARLAVNVLITLVKETTLAGTTLKHRNIRRISSLVVRQLRGQIPDLFTVRRNKRNFGESLFGESIHRFHRHIPQDINDFGLCGAGPQQQSQSTNCSPPAHPRPSLLKNHEHYCRIQEQRQCRENPMNNMVFAPAMNCDQRPAGTW
jgi:hypothetical protein